MYYVKYKERFFLDKYRCIDTENTLRAFSKFTHGGLTYYKVDRFNYEVIDTDFILE